MRALVIDTSTHRGEVALWSGGACVARERNLDPAKHAESLLALIERVFGSAGWRKTDLDLVVPCLGPGSFTGVRVGLATAKGIALALDRAIVGVGGLEAMAHAFCELAPGIARDVDAVVALLDARKSEVYWAVYGREGQTLDGPGHMSAGRLIEVMATLPAKRIVVGEAAAGNLSLPEKSVFRSPETDLPDVAALARLGVRTFEQRGSDDIDALEPIYVRPPDITLPRSN
jgi:tRNA threonylcarbamoyladenosine biosynthesis protein TsaB